MKVKISQDVLQHIRQVVESHYPNESCGFFSGTDNDEARHIQDAWQAKNTSTENKGRRFRIDPLEYMRAEQRTSKTPEVLQGVYHSHPDHPPVPSEHDLASAMPFFSYIIASVNNGKMQEVRSWILNGENKFVEQELILES